MNSTLAVVCILGGYLAAMVVMITVAARTGGKPALRELVGALSMADNGVYSDGYADGRHAMTDEMLELFNNADDAQQLATDIESFLQSEGAL